MPRDFRRKRCWTRVGKRGRTPYYTSRGKGRYNLLPVVTCEGLADWYITEGTINSIKIRDFGERCLVCSPISSLILLSHAFLSCLLLIRFVFLQVPLLQPYPAPRSVVCLDNWKCHHDEEFMDMILATGALILLSPYSPQYNPVRLSCWDSGGCECLLFQVPECIYP